MQVRVEEGGDSFVVPDLLLALWRGSNDPDDPDEDGKPRYFESVLVAAPGYFE
jgi:hypothetical protein